jgi:hypothetical protein
MFSNPNEDLRKIYGVSLRPRMTHIDLLRQKVMSFAFIKRTPRQNSLKNQPIRRILSLAPILLLSECFLVFNRKESQASGDRGVPPRHHLSQSIYVRLWVHLLILGFSYCEMTVRRLN